MSDRPRPLKITSPPIIYSPLNRCLYCDSKTDDLRKEHIVPFGLGGQMIFPRSSCRACEAITGKFEQECLRGMLGPFRHRHGFPTRRKKERPLTIQSLPILEYPRMLYLMKMDAPGILTGRDPSRAFKPRPVIIVHNNDLKKFTAKSWNMGRYRHSDFCRMLAKIAHSYTIAQCGFEALKDFEFLLPELIINDVGAPEHFVGGDPQPSKTPITTLHRLELHLGKVNYYGRTDGRRYVLARIRLFADIGAPGYLVVVARERGSNPQPVFE